MPSFAELKAKAGNLGTASADKFQDVRRRNTSVPMKNTNWDPYSGGAPPPPPPPRSRANQNTKPQSSFLPPPSRTASSASQSLSSSGAPSPEPPPLPSRGPPLPSRGPSSGPPPPPPRGKATTLIPPLFPSQSKPPIANGPPPIVRSTRPDLHPRSVMPKPPTTSSETEIDWSNLSPEDKRIFFSWLDEFFANFTPPSGARDAAVTRQTAINAPSHAPPLRSSTKPASSWNRVPAGNQSAAFTLSYPPHTEHGSAALDLTHYFAPSTPWSEAWYSGKMPVPPRLVNSKDSLHTLSMMTRGPHKTVNIGAIFSDLSFFWGTVEFSTSNPSDMSQVKRNAVYLPRPKALGQQELVEAHESYGETTALFAESFLETGQPCGRGECWDLANEALKNFAQYDYIPKPVQTTSRTHGHLIFEGKASNQGKEMVGRWRGGDDRIRRGDIAEWREVKIGMKGQPASCFYSLGFPDHTAVIVSDSIPLSSAKDGGSLKPSDLGIIVVVEQSQGHLPSRTEYDLSYFQQGEMWIYRPIGMKAYLGLDELTVEPPEEVQTLLQSL